MKEYGLPLKFSCDGIEITEWSDALTKAQKAVQTLQQRIADGLLEGKHLPLTVDLYGVKIRIEQRGVEDAASTQDAQGEEEPEGQGA